MASGHSFEALRSLLRRHSRFLADAINSHPDWLEELTAHQALTSPRSRMDFVRALQDEVFSPEAAARFRRRGLLRIFLRELLGFSHLAEVTREISDLADAILDWSYLHVRSRLNERHGQAFEPTGHICGLSVLSLGKLGGQELNYSSDIDLVFTFGSPGETSGKRSLTHKEYFSQLAQEMTNLLATYTAEGICYRVDLRLRPDGSGGELTHSVQAMRDYFTHRARDWELQMMIKARVSAGESGPGQSIIDFVEPLTYQSSTDFSAIEAVSATRLRLNEKLAARRLKPGVIDVKLARGGIRDIEFLVQCLQRLHGGREHWLRHGGTLLSLGRLHDKALIAPNDYFQLIEAYEFLRQLEHRMQIWDDRQVHTLPVQPDELECLAQRMPPLDSAKKNTASGLLARLQKHLDAVGNIYDRVVHQRRLNVPATPQLEIPAPASGEGPPKYGQDLIPLRHARQSIEYGLP